jgi:hypothetical protein
MSRVHESIPTSCALKLKRKDELKIKDHELLSHSKRIQNEG